MRDRWTVVGLPEQDGLLLIEKHGSDPDQIHPTDAGYGVMVSAFKDAIGTH